MTPPDHPRDHYYRFAHRVLPALLHENPEPFRSAVLAGRVDELLENVWREVATTAGVATDGSLVIRATVHDCAGRSVVIITPPKPAHLTEAHLIGVVLDRNDSSFLRYVVLEHGSDENAQPYTTVGEWTADSHINYGDGPNPTEEAFLSLVCTRFTETPPRRPLA